MAIGSENSCTNVFPDTNGWEQQGSQKQRKNERSKLLVWKEVMRLLNNPTDYYHSARGGVGRVTDCGVRALGF